MSAGFYFKRKLSGTLTVSYSSLFPYGKEGLERRGAPFGAPMQNLFQIRGIIPRKTLYLELLILNNLFRELPSIFGL